MIRFNENRKKYVWDCFSNFCECPIIYERIEYPTVEHAFQAQKTSNTGTKKRIAKAKDAGVAKLIGRNCQLRDDWDEIKEKIMLKLLRVKFKNPLFRYILLSTGEEEIVEVADGWNDMEWGIGRNGKGRNLLGKLLMKVRGEIRKADKGRR